MFTGIVKGKVGSVRNCKGGKFISVAHGDKDRTGEAFTRWVSCFVPEKIECNVAPKDVVIIEGYIKLPVFDDKYGLQEGLYAFSVEKSEFLYEPKVEEKVDECPF